IQRTLKQESRSSIKNVTSYGCKVSGLTQTRNSKTRNPKLNKMEAVAKLRNYPTSPRKMRLLADLIRSEKVEKVLAQREHNPKHPAVPLRKLVLSAINTWKQQNEGGDESELVLKT